MTPAASLRWVLRGLVVLSLLPFSDARPVAVAVAGGGGGARAATVLTPERALRGLPESGRRTIEVAGDAVLRGRWPVTGGPGSSLEIHSRGRLLIDGASFEGAGARLTLRGASVRLVRGARVDLADATGAGGEAELVATGTGPAAAVEVAATAAIDVSGAPGRAGAIRLAGEQVVARGGLTALGRGRIEVEARRGLVVAARIDTGGGLVRLDPGNMIIGNFSGTNTGVDDPDPTHDNLSPSADPGQLDAGLLAGYLATSDVVVHTTMSPGASDGLDPAVTGDNSPGDIWVQAPVYWNSSHHLYLLANDDLIVQASVQNGGTGDVVGVAGWDGTTFTGLGTGLPPPSSVYGNGTGDAFVIGSDDSVMPGTSIGAGVAFGSHGGATALRGRNVTVRGSTSTNLNDSFALVGFHATDSPPPPAPAGFPTDAGGAVTVTATGNISLLGGTTTGNYRYAQIGNGGLIDLTPENGSTQGSLAGTVSVIALGTFHASGGHAEAYVQVGNGGEVRSGASRANVSGDVSLSAAAITLDGVVGTETSGGYAQIGNGGRTWFSGTNHLSATQGNLSGTITVTTPGDLQLLAATSGYFDAQIGHGGFVNTSPDFTLKDPSQTPPSTIGTESGDISVTVGGRLLLQGGALPAAATSFFSGQAQIGNGGYITDGVVGAASGNITVTVTGEADIQGGGPCLNLCTAQVGHGGAVLATLKGPATSRGQLSGTVMLQSTAGAVKLAGGAGVAAYAQVGHGGFLAAEAGSAQLVGASGDVTVAAHGAVSLQGGTTAAGQSYTQIGHGGGMGSFPISGSAAANQGPLSGAVTVTGASLLLLAAPDSGDGPGEGASDAQIGHGGANLGGTQAASTGAVSVTIAGETTLEDDPSGSKWWIGDRPVGSGAGSPVLLDTRTLDFTGTPGAAAATIDNAAFWPRFGAGNDVGGSVRLVVRGASGNDGDLVDQEPLTVAATNPLQVLATRSVTLGSGGAVADSGAAFVDLVADDANPSPPNFGPSAQFVIDGGVTVSGPVRLFAVQTSQFTPGGYVPPAQAGGVWYETAGTPVVGINFKIAPASADLSITKTAGASLVAPGGNLSYTITVANAGPDAAAQVVMSDPLPANTTFASLVAPGGWSCSTPAVGAAGTVSCNVASLAVGSAVFTLTVRVSGALPPGTILHNVATVSSMTADPVPGNNSAAADASVAPAAAVPTLDGAGLAALAVLLALAAVGAVRRQRRRA